MSRPKGSKNKDLPPNLTVKKGIYYYTHPFTGKSKSRGKNRSLAITEAIEANLIIYKPKDSLIEWIKGTEQICFYDWLDKYLEIISQRNLSQNSVRDYKTKISIIRRAFENEPLIDFTPKMIASFIHHYPATSMAKQLKSTLYDLFNEAIAMGHVISNPVSSIKSPKVKIQRSRLTLSQFRKVLALSPEKYFNYFMLSILTGQRLGDITSLKWNDIKDCKLYIIQQKTGSKIAIPLNLRLDVFGVSISEIINNIPKEAETILNVKAVTLRNNFNKHFVELENKPTFHEIRSLSARLYEEEKGAEFASKLLGHKSMAMTSKYLDKRNNEYLEL